MSLCISSVGVCHGRASKPLLTSKNTKRSARRSRLRQLTSSVRVSQVRHEGYLGDVIILKTCCATAEEFNIYMHYVRKLGFEETPDYDFLRELFTKVLRSLGEEDDGIYDWMLLNNGKGWETLPVSASQTHNVSFLVKLTTNLASSSPCRRTSHNTCLASTDEIVATETTGIAAHASLSSPIHPSLSSHLQHVSGQADTIQLRVVHPANMSACSRSLLQVGGLLSNVSTASLNVTKGRVLSLPETHHLIPTLYPTRRTVTVILNTKGRRHCNRRPMAMVTRRIARLLCRRRPITSMVSQRLRRDRAGSVPTVISHGHIR